jgi:hypothetical protein
LQSGYNNCLYPAKEAKSLAVERTGHDWITKSPYETSVGAEFTAYKFTLDGDIFYIDTKAFEPTNHNGGLHKITELPEEMVFCKRSTDSDALAKMYSFTNKIDEYAWQLLLKVYPNTLSVIIKDTRELLFEFRLSSEDDAVTCIYFNNGREEEEKITSDFDFEDWVGRVHYQLEKDNPPIAENLNLVIRDY